MSTSINLIVGLANPGKEYENTRHNAGAWFVELLAELAKVTLRHENKYLGFHATAKLFTHDCHLLIPTTFMNLSGQSVRALCQFYKISPQQILIVHDEIDLPPGDTRLKFDGGNGGHNGLKDIINHLNTKQFYRLRIGVGHPGNSKQVVDYVLHLPKKAERELIDVSLQKALDVMPLVMQGEMQKAMHKLHSEVD